MPTSRYRLIATVGVVTISFSPILIRAAGDGSDMTIAFFRALYALPLLVIIHWRVRERDERPRRSRMLAVASGVFLALDLAFWHASIRQLGAGLATVIVYIQVVYVALLAWLLFGEKPARRSVALLPLILLGIFLISGAGSADAYGDNPGLGTIQALTAGLLYALFILLLRESGRGHSAPPSGPLLDATIGLAIVALIIGVSTEPDFSLEPSWPLHGWLLLLALVAQVIGWLIITKAMPHLPALDTSILLLGQPMLAILWAGMIFDESLGSGQWFGVALVLAGLTLFNLGKPAPDSSEPREQVGESLDDPV
ncbi:MAG: DMT family transporter [Acidimicrobiia bacterium]|nr:DMT family transporter [Acidimicrobiia bacterium]